MSAVVVTLKTCVVMEDIHDSKKDHGNCHCTEKKNKTKQNKNKKTNFIMKTLLIKRNELTGMNIESSLHVCGIAHCT